MDNLNTYITEKLKINSKSNVHNSQEQEWEDLIQKWIKKWSNDDFEYLMALIDKFLVDNTFDNDDYEELLKYEHNNKFKKFLFNEFSKFKADTEKQIQSLKNK